MDVEVRGTLRQYGMPVRRENLKHAPVVAQANVGATLIRLHAGFYPGSQPFLAGESWKQGSRVEASDVKVVEELR